MCLRATVTHRGRTVAAVVVCVHVHVRRVLRCLRMRSILVLLLRVEVRRVLLCVQDGLRLEAGARVGRHVLRKHVLQLLLLQHLLVIGGGRLISENASGLNGALLQFS